VVERYVHDAHGRTFALNSGGCRRTDIDCDGLVGATDLVLVRNAFANPAPSGAREDLCGPGPGNDTPDGIIDDADLACVRADLGLGVSGLYNDAPPAPPTDGYPRPLRTFSLHGLTYDRATGLVFARARYYHPELGRWTRRDPKGYVDGGNLYEAFRSNPARNIDPFGMWYYPANPFVIDHSPEAAEAALIFPRAVVDTGRTAGALAIEAGRLTLPSAGAEGSTVLRFAVLNREFVPDARTVLQNLTNSQNARLAGNLRLAEFYLTEEELISSGLSIGHARMNYGKIVERMVASEVQSDALLRGLFSPAGVGRTGPDFLGQGPANGQLLDITTANPMTIRKHLARPYGEDLTVITYERPAGFP
jgi:RHS repeat-associated protein